MTKSSEELQVEIDDVYACPGRCRGCVLSAGERASRIPDMSSETFDESIRKIKEYASSLSGLKRTNLTFGIGDHFMMEDEYLERICSAGAEFVSEAGLRDGGAVFVTASMIGRHAFIMGKAWAMKKVADEYGVPMHPIAVLDPKNLLHETFSEIYEKNVVESAKLLGRIDLTLNLSSEAMAAMPQESLSDFVVRHGFEEVTVNWAPTSGNAEDTCGDLSALEDWLIGFDESSVREGFSISYRPVMLRTIDDASCTFDEGLGETLFESVWSRFPELLKKSVQIDEAGNVFPKYEAIGDVPHSPRLGFKPWGNVMDGRSLSEMAESGRRETCAYAVKQVSKGHCASCEFSVFCANSGFHIYAASMGKWARRGGCPHVAKAVFGHYRRQIANGLDKGEF